MERERIRTRTYPLLALEINNMKVIVYTRPDGGLSVINPVGLSVDDVFKKDVPSDAINPRIIERSELPSAEHRNAWVDDGGSISVSSEKVVKIKEGNFDIELMTFRLGQEFTGSNAIALAPYLQAFRSLAQAKNFAGMKAFAQGMILDGKGTQQDAAKIREIILEQGINLDNY